MLRGETDRWPFNQHSQGLRARATAGLSQPCGLLRGPGVQRPWRVAMARGVWGQPGAGAWLLLAFGTVAAPLWASVCSGRGL